MTEEQKSIFGMESTVSQSAAGIVRILVLMRMDEMLKDYKRYMDSTPGSGERERLGRASTNSIKGLLTLLRPRMIKKGKYDAAYDQAPQDREQAINLIMEYLEEDLKLIKIDTQQSVDFSSIKNRNAVNLGY